MLSPGRMHGNFDAKWQIIKIFALSSFLQLHIKIPPPSPLQGIYLGRRGEHRERERPVIKYKFQTAIKCLSLLGL